jgi:hypothetical protein
LLVWCGVVCGFVCLFVCWVGVSLCVLSTITPAHPSIHATPRHAPHPTPPTRTKKDNQLNTHGWIAFCLCVCAKPPTKTPAPKPPPREEAKVLFCVCACVSHTFVCVCVRACVCLFVCLFVCLVAVLFFVCVLQRNRDSSSYYDSPARGYVLFVDRPICCWFRLVARFVFVFTPVSFVAI